MKSVFLFLGSILMCTSFAQGTLQFNAVKLVSTTDTVPSGKVWKVESAHLAIRDGIRKPPMFLINNDTVVMGYDSYESTLWENVVSVELQGRLRVGASCHGTITPTLRLIGSGPNAAIDDMLSFGTINTGVLPVSPNWVSLGSVTPSHVGDNQIDQYHLTGTVNGSMLHFPSRYDFRMIVKLASGKNIVLLYTGTSTNTSCYSLNEVSNIFGLTSVATNTVSRPQISTQFPFWLPAGASLAAGDNMHYLSVLEFNIIP